MAATTAEPSLISLLFPLWLLFGVGNDAITRVAPEVNWPPGPDQGAPLRFGMP